MGIKQEGWMEWVQPLIPTSGFYTPPRGEEMRGRRSLRSQAPKNIKPIACAYWVQPPGWPLAAGSFISTGELRGVLHPDLSRGGGFPFPDRRGAFEFRYRPFAG